MNFTHKVAFLYSNNKILERRSKETIPFMTAPKQPYLWVKDLSLENYKTLMNKTVDCKNGWKDLPCSWIGKDNIVKMTILSKATYRCNATSIKILIAFSTVLEQIILNFCMETQRTPNSQNEIESEEQSWRYHAPLASDYTTKSQ